MKNKENIFNNVKFFVSTETEFYIKDVSVLEKIQNFSDQSQLILSREEDERQFEIAVSKKSPLEAAIETEKITKFLSTTDGVLFHPKPEQYKSGCSIQISFSIYIDDFNIFTKINNNFSEPLLHSIGGLLSHMKSAISIFCPQNISYQRFRPVPQDMERKHIHYPVNISWGVNNRTTAVRVPVKGQNVNEYYIENRVPCIHTNSFLAIASTLWCAIDGIVNNINPNQRIYGNAHDEIYNFLEPLPKSLTRAVQIFQSSKLRNALLEFNLVN